MKKLSDGERLAFLAAALGSRLKSAATIGATFTKGKNFEFLLLTRAEAATT